MTKTGALIVVCLLQATFATTALAGRVQGRSVAVRDIRQADIEAGRGWGSVVRRQDLFDRNNPNNIRSDWHAPPAQPGQF